MLRLTLTLGLVSMLAGTVQAGSLVPNTEPLTVSVQKEPVPLAVPIYRAYVTAGSSKFAFLVPNNFRLAGDPAHGKLKLENVEAGSFITFTFLQPEDGGAGTGREAYREVLSSRYAKGKFLGEFSQPADGGMGLGFDVQWASPSGLVQRTRAVYVPTIAGLLEMTITTHTNNYKFGEASLSEIVGSFQASMNGVLDVHHIAATN